MKVAITGASGFIGNRAVEIFHLGLKFEVVPVVHGNSSLVLPARFNLDWKVCDHTSVDQLCRAFESCDFVVNAAFGSPLNRISRSIYRAADRANVKRVVTLSSAAIYNQNPRPGTTESSPLPDKPATPYNAAKIKADDAIRRARDSGRTEVVSLMPMVVFGPRSFWVTRPVEDILRGTAYLINKGEGICNTVYIDNLIEAVRLSLFAKAVDGESFFISDSETVTWADFYAPLLECLGKTAEALHHIDPPRISLPAIREQLLDGLSNVAESPTIQRVKPHVPRRIKRIYKGTRTLLSPKPVVKSEFEFPNEASPAPPLDVALLQQASYKFPNDKAEDRLQYRPVVSFGEGMQRSIKWLEFAGYPILKSTPTEIE